MAIVFRDVSCPPLKNISATAPSGAIIGIIGTDDSGASALLRLAAGLEKPVSGEVRATEPQRLLGVSDLLNLGPVGTLAMEHALSVHDVVVKARSVMALERLRRGGATVLLASHEQNLLLSLCDEIWWVDDGKLAAKGDPQETLDLYNHHVCTLLQEWGRSVSQPLAPSLRRGDGRAEIVTVETLDEEGKPTMVWQSGAKVAVRVKVRFAEEVADPVIGIMIRTRIGFEVYGTNTELEKVKIGPCSAGDTVQVTCRFTCSLCPQEYTLTAASHDPDGVWHDWLDDAVAFSVQDVHHTAGVVNLRAAMEVERI